jgi:two-component system nitrate/nitrite response regulator NarL
MAADIQSLSVRERDVLKLMAAGLTNREIAARLVISENTVQTHVAHVLSKLNVRSRFQAADIWAQQDH